MDGLRRGAAIAVIALALGLVSTPVGWTEGPPSVPAGDPAREAALKRAEELNRKVEALYGQGKYAEAMPLAREALGLWESTLGSDHPQVATGLNNLGLVLSRLGAYAEARPFCERAVATYERAVGRDHPDTAASLQNLAYVVQAEGDFDGAQRFYERSLVILENALGKNHPAVATSLNGLAGVLWARGAYAEARPLYERAVAIYAGAFGPDHLHVAVGLSNLADLLRTLGSYAEARPLYERSIEICEKALGKEHPDIAHPLRGLGALLDAQGAFAEARPLYERALALAEKALGKDHPVVATSLGDLAGLLRAQGAHAEALPLYERALAICEKALGRDHYAVAACLNNLALLLQAQGDLGAARPLFERALAIQEKTLGADHPELATGLDNLALLLREQGAHAEARRSAQRALAIRERALGTEHPAVAVSLNNLAALFDSEGASAEACPLLKRALAITEAHVRTQLSALSASQRLALVRAVRHQLDNWLLFAPRADLPSHAEALRFRGIVARAEAAERALLRAADAGAVRAARDLQAATRLAARLANEVPAFRDPAARSAWQERYARATAQRERLTLELSQRCAPLRSALERLDLTAADVQRAVPPDTAVVDLLRVRDRYLGWILRSTGEAVPVELGAADAIETACQAFVDAIGDDLGDDASRAAITKAGADLRRLAWEPLSARLGEGVRHLVICPDAALASVPFAALPGGRPGRSLLDEYSVSYAFHPFDLVPRKDAPPVGVGALVVGGVDYERAAAGAEESMLPGRSPILAGLDRAPRGGQKFPQIPGTLVEAEVLRGRLGPDAIVLLVGGGATEARLREGVRGRRIVHVATHGFARTDLLAGLYRRRGEGGFLSADAERQLSVGHDPMLLSGLAMAGANPRDGAGGDDGILTALEASYLDLGGVDLVTLSACETARGTAESGEGVLGLVSAFQMAGAASVLASLWKVDDEATLRLMEGVYDRLLRTGTPLSPAAALREAALALRDAKDASGTARFSAPRHWAAFVAYGR